MVKLNVSSWISYKICSWSYFIWIFTLILFLVTYRSISSDRETSESEFHKLYCLQGEERGDEGKCPHLEVNREYFRSLQNLFNIMKLF